MIIWIIDKEDSMSRMLNKGIQRGFTLVELSIVLIIIGFIIAGVAAGQSLIQSAKLNKVITEEQTYEAAINNFRSRYQYLPGDFPKAADIWPTTVNGDGNGFIEYSAEAHASWQHLSLAGAINGMMDNVFIEPVSKYGDGSIWRLESNGFSMYTVPANSVNSLQIMRADSTVFISPQNAYSIDKKIDDGQPSDGRVYTIADTPTGCVTEADGTTFADSSYASTQAKYNLALQDAVCHRIYFYLK